MVNAIEVKKGSVVRIEQDLYNCTFSQFVNPGKGSAFVRTKLKHLKKGNVIERTFKSNEKIDIVELDKKYMAYLYQDGEDYIFMDRDDYDQIPIPGHMVEELLPFMKEEMPVEITFFEGEPVDVIPPTFVEREVIYAEEGLKGDTQGTAKKPVKIETGAEVMVPLYIKQNDTIKVDMRDFSFVERVNK